MLIAGVDEVGRGPLAGPVVAAAVVLDPARLPAGIDDSKRLNDRQRRRLDEQIRSTAICFAIAEADVGEIDRLNILQATLLAMQRAVASLSPAPDRALVDGNRLPRLDCPAEAIVGGDRSTPVIAAASIIAKVYRDDLMQRLDAEFPGYGFARNKGYPSVEHRCALSLLGVTPHHRRSFAPVKAMLGAE